MKCAVKACNAETGGTIQKSVYCYQHYYAWGGYVAGWMFGTGKDVTRGKNGERLRAYFLEQESSLVEGEREFFRILASANSPKHMTAKPKEK